MGHPAVEAVMTTLYTFGYLSARSERIITELIAVRTPLVDIRYNPTSRHWQYTQDALSKRAGDLYFHLVELGNENYQSALDGKYQEPGVKFHDLETGLIRLSVLLSDYGRAAIFCACSSKKTCHRIRVAELAKERLGVWVIHL